MPLFKTIENNEYTIGIWNITESIAEIEEHPFAANYKVESLKFKSENRRKEWLVTRILLHTLVGVAIPIKYESSGRPYLENSSLNISISHTQGYVSIILSSKHDVSIDIECISKRIHRVAHRVFDTGETFYQKENSLIYELLIWSSKEALYKILNVSKIDFKKHLRVYPFELDAHQIKVQEFKTPACKEYTVYYQVKLDYVLTYIVA